MSYQVLSRKWRPQRFEEIIGQEHVTRTITNAIQKDRVAHAYLFTGPRGVGKTSTARILAKTLNCEQRDGHNPCNQCRNCREITESRSLDVFEIDGASNRGIDEIRNLRENVKYPPQAAPYKIYIIDEVHMLTKEAFNALLKTLEEPPPQVFFIFATTEPSKVPPTIISRCQRFDFRRIPIQEIVNQLRRIAELEGVKIDEASLLLLARKSDGSMRDSQSLLDQAIALCGQEINVEELQNILGVIDASLYFQLEDHLFNKNYAGILDLITQVRDRGYNLQEFIEGITEHFRNILYIKITGETLLIDTPDNIKESYQKSINRWDERDLLTIIQILSTASQEIKNISNQQVYTEFLLMKIAYLDRSVRIEQLLDKLASADVKNLTERKRGGENISLFSIDKQSRPVSEVREPARRIEKPPVVSDKSETTSSEQKNKITEEKLTIEIIRRHWQDFLDYLEKEKNVSLASLVVNSLPVDFQDSTLQLSCDTVGEFKLSALQQRIADLEGSLKKFFQHEIKVKLLKSKSADNISPGKDVSLDAEAQLILKLFDGRIIRKESRK